MFNKDVLIELMAKARDYGIGELIITHDRVEIRTGSSAHPTAAPDQTAMVSSVSAPAVAAPARAAADKMPPPPSPALANAAATTVTAPIPGAVFVAPALDLQQKPLPAPGMEVKEGDVVALVEAMKMFNEIFAPTDGIIESITVSNKAPVKVGDCIMRIRAHNG